LGVVFLTCYLMPLCFITIFYSLIGIKVWRRGVKGIRGSKAEKNIQRSKIRIVRMLITVAVVFALSWMPLYTLKVFLVYGKPSSKEARKFLGNYVIPWAQWLGSATSAVNPFIYCYFSEQFRKYILELIQCFRCRYQRIEHRNNGTKSTYVTTCATETTAPNRNNGK
jgi:hypothetical protein